jgi:NNP family nitrate/nitrite transporter-like MFS transporter
MNLFARFLGGWIADRFGAAGGISARIAWLAAVLVGEGLFLIAFGRIDSVTLAIPALLTLGLFVKMGNGANYAIVPFLQRDNLGMVAGLVGAGGNVGAVLAGILFRAPTSEWNGVLQTLGVAVLCCAIFPIAMAIRERMMRQPVSIVPAALEASMVEGR